MFQPKFIEFYRIFIFKQTFFVFFVNIFLRISPKLSICSLGKSKIKKILIPKTIVFDFLSNFLYKKL